MDIDDHGVDWIAQKIDQGENRRWTSGDRSGCECDGPSYVPVSESPNGVARQHLLTIFKAGSLEFGREYRMIEGTSTHPIQDGRWESFVVPCILASLNIVAMDVVELSPAYDTTSKHQIPSLVVDVGFGRDLGDCCCRYGI